MSTEKEYEKLLKKIATNIKKHRKRLGLTQEDMTIKAGFNYRFFQKLESGKHSLNLYTLFKVSKALKLDVSELIK